MDSPSGVDVGATWRFSVNMELVFKAIFLMGKGEGNGRLEAGRRRVNTVRYVINTE